MNSVVDSFESFVKKCKKGVDEKGRAWYINIRFTREAQVFNLIKIKLKKLEKSC